MRPAFNHLAQRVGAFVLDPADLRDAIEGAELLRDLGSPEIEPKEAETLATAYQSWFRLTGKEWAPAAAWTESDHRLKADDLGNGKCSCGKWTRSGYYLLHQLEQEHQRHVRLVSEEVTA